ncbi:MAG: hypothetical protein ABMB14_06800 [Myxococcota bacterium]
MRFGFGSKATPRLEVPSGQVVRLSVAWWAETLDDPSPVFVGSAEAPRTVVVVWHTDTKGYLLDADQWLVREWRLTGDVFAHLRSLHGSFHLGSHDVLVTGGETQRILPCRESLYRLVPNLRLADTIESAVTELEAS